MVDLENIYRDAIRAVDPAGLIRSSVSKDGQQLTIHGQEMQISEDLSSYLQVIVLGMGKASARMAAAMASILEDNLSAGFIVTKYGYERELGTIQVLEAGHPVPDEKRRFRKR